MGWRGLLGVGCVFFLPACGDAPASAPGEGGASGGGAGGAQAGTAGQGGSAGAGAAGGTGGAAGVGAGGAAGAGAGGIGGSAGNGGGPCAPTALPAGQTSSIALEFGGARSYLLRVPAGYDGSSPLPLVVQLHGYTYTASGHEDYTSMSPLADAEGFAVAYPQGVGNSWNGGACCGNAASGGVDDVGFVRAVVADIRSQLCVDGKRIYASGMSNGGFLSHRLGCEAADLFAAIAPVDGVLGIPAGDCQPVRPISVMHFHGTADVVVPYGGNPLINYISVAETMTDWRGRNGCGESARTSFSNGDARCETHFGCDADTEVVLCTIQGMGHCWPGRSSCLFSASTDISATSAMWEFFKQHTLP